MIDNQLREWLKQPKSYLPEPLQDFHDQKQIFKRLQEIVDSKGWYDKPPDWVTLHIYTVDIFLWFMAAHGYTLQKSRTPLDRRPPFCDLEATMKDLQNRCYESCQKRVERKISSTETGATVNDFSLELSLEQEFACIEFNNSVKALGKMPPDKAIATAQSMLSDLYRQNAILRALFASAAKNGSTCQLAGSIFEAATKELLTAIHDPQFVERAAEAAYLAQQHWLNPTVLPNAAKPIPWADVPSNEQEGYRLGVIAVLGNELEHLRTFAAVKGGDRWN